MKICCTSVLFSKVGSTSLEFKIIWFCGTQRGAAFFLLISLMVGWSNGRRQQAHTLLPLQSGKYHTRLKSLLCTIFLRLSVTVTPRLYGSWLLSYEYPFSVSVLLAITESGLDQTRNKSWTTLAKGKFATSPVLLGQISHFSTFPGVSGNRSSTLVQLPVL